MPKGVKWKSVKKKKAIRIARITTIEEADAHQRKHGFKPLITAREKQLGQVHGEVDLNKRKGKLRGKVREMNKTEREFSILLEARKRHAEITDYRYHAVKLLWGDCMIYTADFAVDALMHARITLMEVKGPHIFSRDIVRFKGCRAEWKEWFDFEMHQRDKSGRWDRIL